MLVLLAVATAVLGSALGLGVSTLATTEFQAVQFMPAVVLPQILLCGLFAPTERMAGWLDGLSRVMPLRYAAQGMVELTGAASVPSTVWVDLAVVAGIAVAALRTPTKDHRDQERPFSADSRRKVPGRSAASLR